MSSLLFQKARLFPQFCLQDQLLSPKNSLFHQLLPYDLKQRPNTHLYCIYEVLLSLQSVPALSHISFLQFLSGQIHLSPTNHRHHIPHQIVKFLYMLAESTLRLHQFHLDVLHHPLIFANVSHHSANSTQSTVSLLHFP